MKKKFKGKADLKLEAGLSGEETDTAENYWIRGAQGDLQNDHKFKLLKLYWSKSLNVQLLMFIIHQQIQEYISKSDEIALCYQMLTPMHLGTC